MRELVLRMERSERAMLGELREFRERSTAEHREMIEELRAGRGALLAILDQLGRGGSPA